MIGGAEKFVSKMLAKIGWFGIGEVFQNYGLSSYINASLHTMRGISSPSMKMSL